MIRRIEAAIFALLVGIATGAILLIVMQLLCFVLTGWTVFDWPRQRWLAAGALGGLSTLVAVLMWTRPRRPSR